MTRSIEKLQRQLKSLKNILNEWVGDIEYFLCCHYENYDQGKGISDNAVAILLSICATEDCIPIISTNDALERTRTCSKILLPFTTEYIVLLLLVISESVSCLHFSRSSLRFNSTSPDPVGMGADLLSRLMDYLD